MRYGMVLDLIGCVGCNACALACRQENATPADVLFTRVITLETGQYPNTRLEFQPLLCMHCQDAPCVTVCPTGASYQREDGIVAVDQDKCVGCRYCMAACPYHARTFHYGKLAQYFPGQGETPYEQARGDEHQRGVVAKCDFCFDRLENGDQPACVETCPGQVRIFGDLDDPDSEVARLVASGQAVPLYPELGTEPSVFYIRG